MVDEPRGVREQLLIYQALTVAADDAHTVLDAVVGASDPDAARRALELRYGFTETQAWAVMADARAAASFTMTDDGHGRSHGRFTTPPCTPMLRKHLLALTSMPMTMRWVRCGSGALRPASRTTDSPPRTIGMIPARHASLRASSALIRSPVSSEDRKPSTVGDTRTHPFPAH